MWLWRLTIWNGYTWITSDCVDKLLIFCFEGWSWALQSISSSRDILPGPLGASYQPLLLVERYHYWYSYPTTVHEPSERIHTSFTRVIHHSHVLYIIHTCYRHATAAAQSWHHASPHPLPVVHLRTRVSDIRLLGTILITRTPPTYVPYPNQVCP